MGVLATGAILANSRADRELGDIVHDNLVDTPSDEWAEAIHLNSDFGDGFYTLPVFGAAFVIGRIGDEIPALNIVGDWGENSLRIFTVGALPLVVLQRVTGGSRPGESAHQSHWQPFRDSNGVSGHAFMGAIPFLAAAELTENRWVKVGLVAASVLPGFSRLTDAEHYPSQVLIGWSLAYLATSAVSETNEMNAGGWQLVPLPVEHGQGAGLEIRW